MSLNNTLKILNRLLESNNYTLNQKEVKIRLFSDPENQVLAITNTLDFFKIENIVANVPASTFRELPKTFIAQLEKNETYNIALIKKQNNGKIIATTDDDKTLTFDEEEFFVHWTGLVIAIEQNDAKKAKVKPLSTSSLIIVVSAILAVTSIYLSTYSLFKVGYFLLSLIGLGLSYLILKEKFGYATIAEKFCTVSKTSDCQSVLNSEGANIFPGVDLSDVVIVYFSFQLLSFTGFPSSNAFLMLAILSIPAILYSIFYQFRIIKKWCPLCLGISGVLAAQFVLMLYSFKSYSFEPGSMLFILFILSVVSIVWAMSKPLVDLAEKHESAMIENLKFRRNHHLFLPYYNSLRKIDSFVTPDSAIQMGEEKAPICITLIINPVCKACQKVHKTVMSLLENDSYDLKINFLFLVPNENQSDIRVKISKRLLQIYQEYSKEDFNEAFNQWYKIKDPDKWISKWGECKEEKYEIILTQQVQKCLRNNIRKTPTLLINGRLFPETYDPNDIENFIEPIISYEKEKTQNNVQKIHA